MKCLYCNGELKAWPVTLDEHVGGVLVTLAEVPGEVCPGCGEQYVSGSIVARLEQMLGPDAWRSGRRHRRLTMTDLAAPPGGER